MLRSIAGSKGLKRTDPSSLKDEGTKFFKTSGNIIPAM
jgi:hypothetical protein